MYKNILLFRTQIRSINFDNLYIDYIKLFCEFIQDIELNIDIDYFRLILNSKINNSDTKEVLTNILLLNHKNIDCDKFITSATALIARLKGE